MEVVQRSAEKSPELVESARLIRPREVVGVATSTGEGREVLRVNQVTTFGTFWPKSSKAASSTVAAHGEAKFEGLKRAFYTNQHLGSEVTMLLILS